MTILRNSHGDVRYRFDSQGRALEYREDQVRRDAEREDQARRDRLQARSDESLAQARNQWRTDSAQAKPPTSERRGDSAVARQAAGAAIRDQWRTPSSI